MSSVVCDNLIRASSVYRPFHREMSINLGENELTIFMDRGTDEQMEENFSFGRGVLKYLINTIKGHTCKLKHKKEV